MKSKILNAKNIPLDKRSIYLRSLVYLTIQKEKRGHIGPAMSLIELKLLMLESMLHHQS